MDSVPATLPTCWNLSLTTKSWLGHFQSFTDMHWTAQSLPPNGHVSNWGRIKWRSAFLLQLSYCEQVSFLQSIWCHMFHIFLLFCWRFFYLQWPLWALRERAERWSVSCPSNSFLKLVSSLQRESSPLFLGPLPRMFLFYSICSLSQLRALHGKPLRITCKPEL